MAILDAYIRAGTTIVSKHFLKGMGPDLLLLFDGNWWFRVNAFPCEKMEDRDNLWRNLTSRSVLDEKHTKKDISPKIVTSEHDMSWLVRKFRGSEDIPQRRIQTDANIPTQRYSWNKRPNSFGPNLRLPANHDGFEDGNHQKQVPILYRIICLKKATNFVVTNNCLSCFQKAVLVCFPPPQATDN